MIHPPARRSVVTGAAGFIGSHLVDCLLAAGHDVVGIDSFTSYYDPASKRANVAPAAAHQRFQLLPADLVELDLDEVLRPGDWLFHLAAQPGVRASWGPGFAEYVKQNIVATQRLLEAARRAGVARVVFASSSSVYGDAPMPMDEEGQTRPISPYGVTKLTAEQLCLAYWRAFGLEVVPLRFFSVYGPRQRPDMAFHRFIEAILDRSLVSVYSTGDQRRDFTYVSDVVRVLVAAAERGQPGIPVNVGGGSMVSVNEALAIIEQLVERRALIKHEPAPPGDARDTQAATHRLDKLDDLPRVGIRVGLENQVAWHLRRRARMTPDVTSRSRRRSGGTNPDDGAVVLYSHDTYGLGHLRRNLAIAHAMIEREPRTRVVMLTGQPVADEWRRQTPVELVSLPAVVKVGAEEYRPVARRSVPGLLAERAGTIASTLMRFHPRTVLVDHAPLGMKGELLLALQLMRERHPDTHIVLGLRDILDDPRTVVQTWRDEGVYEVLESSYDAVLVYGCPELFDVRELYELPTAVRARTTFTGYVAKAPEMEARPAGSLPWSVPTGGGPRFLVTGGGGGDAAELLAAFLGAWPAISGQTGGSAVLVAGPRMAGAERVGLASTAAAMPDIRLLESSVSMLTLISEADVVVSMGGYNTVVEALSARRPLIIVPRLAPRREQLIRARVMTDLGLAWSVLPGPDVVRNLVTTVLDVVAIGPLPAEIWGRLDLMGSQRAAEAILQQRSQVPPA
jgi:predicted glycosyltransferase/nucleoside-diphosphate-sugar epimerase